MKIKLDENILNSYLQTVELNIQAADFYNEYFNNFNDYLSFNMSIFDYMLECLKIDKTDPDFINFMKNYNLDKLTQLSLKDYNNNPFIKNFKLSHSTIFNKYELCYNQYNPFELFIYDEIEVDEKNYYKETYKVGYFNNSFKYIELNKNNVTWMSTIPHEFNTMKQDINKVKGNILVLGLGLGYFPYVTSQKDNIKEITIIELDKEIISIFKNKLLPFYENKSKINIIHDDALKYLKENDLSKYDYVYCDLYHNAQDGLKFYVEIKQIEEKYKNTNTAFLYWIEKNILCYIRRIVLSIIESELCSPKGFISSSTTYEDRLASLLFKKIKNIEIQNKKEMDYFLSDKNLKDLISC